jgi:superfamily II DNA or RNA helicase
MKPTTNEIKREIQLRAHDTWTASERHGTLAMGTGAGKSYIAVHEAKRMWLEGELLGPEDILVVSPTEKLRDSNWPAEFEKWDAAEVYNKHVRSICFASLSRERGKKYKLVILDEIHHLTELSAKAFIPALVGDTDENADELSHFFSENFAEAVMGLTATVPDPKREPEKYALIKQLAPVVFHYTLDQAVDEGMIADYEIRVILSPLDNYVKVIDGGSKKYGFFKTTEFAHYQYLEKQILQAYTLAKQNPKCAKLPTFRTFARNRFIYNLPSKTEIAKKLLAKVLPGKRTLVFCGSIEQSEALMPGATFHSKTSDAAFRSFNNKELDSLGVVNAANEGHNFTELDQAVIVQLDSNPRNLVQRIGRCLRLRDGHKAVVYIIVAQGTADEKWLEKALGDFDRNKIGYYSSKMI